MKIVYNNVIPFKGFKCINLFGVLFVRKGCTLSEVELNHEAIHTRQMREMGYIFFYLFYLLEWLIRLPFGNAYRRISFEQEAYSNQCYLLYTEERRWFAWTSYI